MKKTVYIVCVCVLSVLTFYEAKQNWGHHTGSGIYVPTAHFVAQVAEENKEREKEEDSKKIAYLTFDDGPSETTRTILETLREKEAVATFFLIGNEITPEREDIVKQAIEQGNGIGVHTYCHKRNTIYCDADSFFEDFQMASETIKKITGKEPKLHRFPWGSNNRYVSYYVDELHERLQKMGVK
ncbi:MAG: polysaccharide deacetylase family protein, partial [Lachnospiraceae bacterium]|nr:polysaccharide deacetylase family protein [Lachnospiraceae bacterium]